MPNFDVRVGMTDLEKAREVLRQTRKHIENGRWIKNMWRFADRKCLHGHLADETRYINASLSPTPVDGLVFYSVWKALPEWADQSIPTFNDDPRTRLLDVIEVLDKTEKEPCLSGCPPRST